MNEIWRKILRFLLLWLVIFVILLVLAAWTYWEELCDAISGSVNSMIYSLLLIIITVGVLVWILQSIFGRR